MNIEMENVFKAAENGADALIAELKEKFTDEALIEQLSIGDEESSIVYIPIEKLYPHPDNPRKDLGDLTELAESIKEKGVLQNLTVVPRGRHLHHHYRTPPLRCVEDRGAFEASLRYNRDDREGAGGDHAP